MYSSIFFVCVFCFCIKEAFTLPRFDVKYQCCISLKDAFEKEEEKRQRARLVGRHAAEQNTPRAPLLSELDGVSDSAHFKNKERLLQHLCLK